MVLTLPPLNALRAFEAAARRGSYVAAAEELGVSPAAISQQIRKLEDYLGRSLFTRLNNRIVLTDAGGALFGSVAGALQSISDFTGVMKADRSRTRLVISTIESVAERWLQPRLAACARANPDLRFDLRIEADPVDFAAHNIDLRLCYGAVGYGDMSIRPLFQDRVVPMCSPDYLARMPAVAKDGMQAVPRDDLIHTSWGPHFGSLPTWQHWFARAGLPAPRAGDGFQIGKASLVLDFARDGGGVALGQSGLAEADLRAGRLVTLSGVSLPLGHPYHLVCPPGKLRRPGLMRLANWLMHGLHVPANPWAHVVETAEMMGEDGAAGGISPFRPAES